MAVLNKIRQRSIFLIIIIAMALFAFVLADVFQSGGFTSEKSLNTVGTINGTDIQREDFSQKVDNALRNLGPTATNLQAMKTVWNMEVRRILLEQEYEELGLTVSSAQLRNAMAQQLSANPDFLNEAGVFDYNRLQEYVSDIKANNPARYQEFLNFEESIAQNLREQTYFNMIRAGITPTVAEAEFEYRLENDKVSIEYVQIPYTTVPDEEVTVTDEEIRAYVKKHPKRFKVEPSIDVQYVLFDEKPSLVDEEQVKEEITSLLDESVQYNAVTKEFDTVPGFRRTRDHAAFVNQFSDAQYVDRWWFKDQLPANISDSIFYLSEGEVFGPYKVDFSYNLSKVIEVRQIADSIQANHILISWQGLQTAPQATRTKEEAKKLADSILNVVRKDVTKFEEVATTLSDDPSVSENKGDLGYLSPGSTVKPFDEFLINNGKGEKGVVETDFGYHVIYIEDKKNEQRAIKVANIFKSVDPSEETLNEVFTTTTKFESQAIEKGFVEVAKESNYMVRPVNRVGQLEENIPGIGTDRSIVNWAFEKGTKVGDIKRFNVNDGYAIVQLTRRNQEGLMEAAEASAIVAPILRTEKKAKIIKESIKGSSLEEIANERNISVKTASALTLSNPTIVEAGTEPKVVGTAFGLKEGQTSGFVEGKNGVYKIKVTSVSKAPQLDNYTRYINQIDAKRKANLNTKVVEALKEKADIEDNRPAIY